MLNPASLLDAQEIQKFIYERVSTSAKFHGVVIWVPVDRYPDGFVATVWVGHEPDHAMQKFASELETELATRGTPCTILVKSDKELPRGGTYKLLSKRGEFSYRNYRVDPIGDEEWVFVFALYRGQETYRFRVSLTRTLASMLRRRNLLDDDRLLRVYLDEVKRRIEGDTVERDGLNRIMFSSRDLSRFVRN